MALVRLAENYGLQTMLPLFTHPLAFLGLLSLPALAAIYFLHSRHRRQVVSSLILWRDPTLTRDGGTRIERLQTPLLFFLELLALALLALAAAGPHVLGARGARPLVVVLDDSFSMQAGGKDSPRARAVAALAEELRARPRYSIRFLLAGERAEVLGEPARSASEALLTLEQWKCRASQARLDEAVSLAMELGSEWALVLVLTDHEPKTKLDKGRLQWWCFGEPRSNIAFVNAARTARDDVERCLIEIANLSEQPGSSTLVLETGDPPQEFQRTRLQFDAGETRRIVLQLKPNTPALRGRLDDDDLPFDNRIWLQPAVQRKVRVEISVKDEVLRKLVEKAVKATYGTNITAIKPELLLTDDEKAGAANPETWVLRLLSEKDAEAYAGPFVVDRAHPLTEGLSLQGVAWGAGKSEQVPGTPVVMAGNIPLLTDLDTLTGRHDLRLRLRPDLSTLQDTPNWPALIQNLIQWRASQAAGLSRVNVRLGEEVMATFQNAKTSVQLTPPDGKERTVPAQGKRLALRPDEPGVYQIQTDEGALAFAANVLYREESDLRKAATGRFGDWIDEMALRLEYQNVSWIALLLVLALLALHGWLVARNRRSGA
jgi:hypothetical protein